MVFYHLSSGSGTFLFFFSFLCNYGLKILLYGFKAKPESRILAFYLDGFHDSLPVFTRTHFWLILSLHKISSSHRLHFWKFQLQENSVSVYSLLIWTQKEWYLEVWVHFLVFNARHHGGRGTEISYSAITVKSLLSDINLTLWCKLEGMAPGKCIYRRARSILNTGGVSTTTKDASNSHGPINTSKRSPHMQRFSFGKTLIPSCHLAVSGSHQHQSG